MHSVSLALKEPQSDAVELKPWMTISDLYCRLTVKFYCYALLVIWLMEAYILSYNIETLK